MSFHENFWLAASAAAPVITLATVVVIPDAAGIRFRAWNREHELLHFHVPATEPERRNFEERLRKLERSVQVTTLYARLCYANLIVQAALLAVSLGALAYSRDFVPPWLAIVVAVGGVALLAWTQLRGTGIRLQVERAINDDQ